MPPAVLRVFVVPATLAAHVSSDRAALDDLAARFATREPALFRFADGDDAGHFDGAVAAATWVRRFPRSWFALSTNTPEAAGHPYNLARRIASIEQLSRGRAAWVHALPTTDADFVSVVQQLWRSWPAESISTSVDAPHFADVTGIRRLNATGAYPVAGPLNVPSSPQGLPVVVASGPDADAHRYVDLIAHDGVWRTPEGVIAARETSANDLAALHDLAAALPAGDAEPQTLRRRLGLAVPILEELPTASARFGTAVEAS